MRVFFYFAIRVFVFVFVFVGFPDLRTEIYRFKNGPNPNAWAVWLLASSSHVMAE